MNFRSEIPEGWDLLLIPYSFPFISLGILSVPEHSRPCLPGMLMASAGDGSQAHSANVDSGKFKWPR